MRQAVDDADIQLVLQDSCLADAIVQTGFSSPISSITIANRDSVIAALIDYNCLIKTKAMMDQFISGLDTSNVYKTVRQHPAIISETVFCSLK